MSTRSATIIRQTTYWGEQAETEELMRFYRHCDGYPEGHGMDMAKSVIASDERGANGDGGTYEIWDVGDGCGIYVDFNPCPFMPSKPETMAFPYDLRRKKVTSWNELGVWYEDATGGKAVRELGYEPIEENYR